MEARWLEKKKKHADDTTLHVLQPSDAQIALDDSIALFCAATCSQLNVIAIWHRLPLLTR